MKKIISILLKLIPLYLILFLFYNSVIFLSNSNYLKHISIKYILLPNEAAVIFNKAFLFFTFSMFVMILHSRGHLWMYGINSLNFKKYIYKYLVFFALILFVFSQDKNYDSRIIYNGSNVSLYLQYFTKVVALPIALVIFYLGLIQTWISKNIFNEYENLIYKLNNTAVIFILFYTFENLGFAFSIYIPIVILNSIVYLLSKSLLIPLIGQILFSLFLILR